MRRHHDAVGEWVDWLLVESEKRPLSVTWVNHWSVQQVLARTNVSLLDFDQVGIDGTLLNWLMGWPVARTSADLVLPQLLRARPGLRVIHVGGPEEQTHRVRQRLEEILAPGGCVVAAVPGYGPMAQPLAIAELVAQAVPHVVIIGMGAGLQEEVALAVARVMRAGIVMTCGGWLDQVVQRAYYPWWAYPLRLNWAVRLAREPRRLWRRYSIGAAHAVLRRGQLRELLSDRLALAPDGARF